MHDRKAAPERGDFTGAWRFFLGWGQVWLTLLRNESLRQQLVSSPHSRGQIHAVNPLRNVDAWYAGWRIDASQRQYLAPADRVRIWLQCHPPDIYAGRQMGSSGLR
ncbi:MULTISPECIES: M13-type metalloendopeptidase [Sphingomonas]|uniref:M13-type metalloendopeptidase n=1 Tax=Sphingomonas TaxID=13687 RepID=UPI001FB5F7A8|nr:MULTISPECIES: M13-type metalloendopeptidase [Sphingomonas]